MKGVTIMTDIRFCEMAERKCKLSNCTLLEFNSIHCLMLVHSPVIDGLFIYQYDDNKPDESDFAWHILRGVPNTNEGFQYIMDLYQMFITRPQDHKKR